MSPRGEKANAEVQLRCKGGTETQHSILWPRQQVGTSCFPDMWATYLHLMIGLEGILERGARDHLGCSADALPSTIAGTYRLDSID